METLVRGKEKGGKARIRRKPVWEEEKEVDSKAKLYATCSVSVCHVDYL